MTACLIAIMTVVRPAQSQETKSAEPNVAAANRAVQSELPFGDRQDSRTRCGDLSRQHLTRSIQIGTHFLSMRRATVNPSLWRQAQLNAINGLFKVTRHLSVRDFRVRYDDRGRYTRSHSHRHTFYTRSAARLSTFIMRIVLESAGGVIYSTVTAITLAAQAAWSRQADVTAGKTKNHCAVGFMEAVHGESVCRRKPNSRARSTVWNAAAPENGGPLIRRWQDRVSRSERV